MPPETVLESVKLWLPPELKLAVPLTLTGAEMMSVMAPDDIAVVVTDAFTKRMVEPPSVNVPVRETVPLLVNKSESMFTVPRLLVVVVCVVPPNTNAKVPEVSTAVDQFDVVPQLAFVVPLHEDSVPA
jgi:hypothetical protein